MSSCNPYKTWVTWWSSSISKITKKYNLVGKVIPASSVFGGWGWDTAWEKDFITIEVIFPRTLIRHLSPWVLCLQVCGAGIEPRASYTPGKHSTTVLPTSPPPQPASTLYLNAKLSSSPFPSLLFHTFSPMWYPFHPRCLPKGKLFKTVLCSFQFCASFSVLGCRKPGHQQAESQGDWLCGTRRSQKSLLAHHGRSYSGIFLSGQRKKYYIYHL